MIINVIIWTHYFYYNETINQYQCTKEKVCPDIYNKLVIDTNQCVKSCNETEEYKYEYNNKCFKKCPNNFIEYENYCQPNCSEEKPFLLFETLECISKCKLEEYQKVCIRVFFNDVNNVVKNLFNLNNINNSNNDTNRVKLSDIIIVSLMKGDLEDILDQLIYYN